MSTQSHSSSSSFGSAKSSGPSSSGVISSSSSSGEYFIELYFYDAQGGFPDNTNIKYRSIVDPGGSKLISAPYADDYTMEWNTDTDTISRVFDISALSKASGSHYVDGLVHNGNAYFNPHSAAGYLIGDTTASPVTYSSVGSAYQVRSGAVASNDILYSPTFSGNPGNNVFVRRLDTSTDSMLANLIMPISRDGPIYYERADWETENSTYFGLYNQHWGAIKDANENIVLIPYTLDRIGIVDPVTNTASQGSDFLTGNSALPTGPLTSSIINNHPYFHKYCGAAISWLNPSCIYAMGRQAFSILKIDTSNYSATEIPLPSPLDASNQPDQSRSFSTVLLSNGMIGSVPWQMPYFFWIDPRNDQITVFDISTNLTSTLVSGNYFSYGVSRNGATYFPPASSKRAMKIVTGTTPPAI